MVFQKRKKSRISNMLILFVFLNKKGWPFPTTRMVNANLLNLRVEERILPVQFRHHILQGAVVKHSCEFTVDIPL